MSTSDSQQLFVGNLPHDCTEDHLTDLFGKFGKVKLIFFIPCQDHLWRVSKCWCFNLKVTDVRINQKQGRDNQVARGGKAPQFVPNFGFIVFESTDCVERALAAKPIMLYGNHRYFFQQREPTSSELYSFSALQPWYLRRLFLSITLTAVPGWMWRKRRWERQGMGTLTRIGGRTTEATGEVRITWGGPDIQGEEVRPVSNGLLRNLHAKLVKYFFPTFALSGGGGGGGERGRGDRGGRGGGRYFTDDVKWF